MTLYKNIYGGPPGAKRPYVRYIYIYILAASLLRKAASCCGGPPVASRPTKRLVSKNGLGPPQNDLGGFRDQAYHFQHQKLSLYAQSREPFHTGHCRPFRQTGLGRPQNDLGGCRDQAYHFQHQKLPLYARAGSHSIQGMAGHSRQTRKQTNKFLFALLV